MIELNVQTRAVVGKGTKALRKSGFLPAVLYGEAVQTQSLAVSRLDFEKAYRQAGESTLLALVLEGKTHSVLIHDVAYDPLRGNPIHADFYAVRMDRVIRTAVPLQFIGDAPAVKNEEGVLVKVLYELEVEALPQNLPHELIVDIRALNAIGAKLFVKDIVLPEGVKIMVDQEDILALIEAPRAETEVVAEETPVIEVKTEREIKQEEKAKATGVAQEEE